MLLSYLLPRSTYICLHTQLMEEILADNVMAAHLGKQTTSANITNSGMLNGSDRFNHDVRWFDKQ